MSDINITISEYPINVTATSTPVEVTASQVGIQGIQGPSGNNGGGGSAIDISGLISTGNADLRYYSINNPSGYINGFNSGIYYLNTNPLNFIKSGEVNGVYALLTTVESTGTNIISLLNNYVLKSNTGNFITTQNLNGLISTGAADLRYLNSGASGAFYASSNPNFYSSSGNVENTGTALLNQINSLNNIKFITGAGTNSYLPQFTNDGSGLINSAIINSGNVIVFGLPINGTGLLSGMRAAIPRGSFGNFGIQDGSTTGIGLAFTTNSNLTYGSIYSAAPTFTIQGSDRSVVLSPNGAANGLSINGNLNLNRSAPHFISFQNSNGTTTYGTINIQNDTTKSFLISTTGKMILSGSSVGINCFPISALDVSGSLAIRPVLSSGNNITLGSNSFCVHTGYNTTDLWTLPSLASCPGRFYWIKNRGGILTISGQVGEQLFSTQVINSLMVNSGEAYQIGNSTEYWEVM